MESELMNEEESHEIHGHSVHLSERRASGERSLFLHTSSAAITNGIISKVLASSRFAWRYQCGAVSRAVQLDESGWSSARWDGPSCLLPDGSALFALSPACLRSF